MTTHSEVPDIRLKRIEPRPAWRMPAPRDNDRGGAIVSFLFHALLILLIIYAPLAAGDLVVLDPNLLAAGPAGPAGGGGGGIGGSGGAAPRITYIRPVAAPALVFEIAKPEEVVEPPKPEIPTPPVPEVVVKEPEIQVAVIDIKVELPPTTLAISVVPGFGGGSGRDGTMGDGPGRGGGVGSGIGTGRGSGIGPGSGGGGSLGYYPPSPIEIFIPPNPPASLKGSQVVAEFEVDATGRVIGEPRFNRTRDNNYNRRLLEVLKAIRFRPATSLDGVPMSAKFQMILEF